MNRNKKPNRLRVWGHGMVNKLMAITRKRRKREASKKRPQIQRRELQSLIVDVGC